MAYDQLPFMNIPEVPATALQNYGVHVFGTPSAFTLGILICSQYCSEKQPHFWLALRLLSLGGYEV
jgi:hypothetical protein